MPSTKSAKVKNNEQFFRMWPRALFHSKNGKDFLQTHLGGGGVYVLYRNEEPYYIGKSKRLFKRLRTHALRPNARRYNFWNYFSAFQIENDADRNRIEAIRISAMPTANSASPRLNRTRLDRQMCRLLNDIQSMMLTGLADRSGETTPEQTEDEEA